MTRIEKIALPAVIFLLFAACCMHIMVAYVGDKTWLLLAAEMLFQGYRLDVDVIEVNPPLIIWLYAVAVWISLHLSFLRDYNVMGLMGLAGAALSVWLSMGLIRLHPAFSGDRRKQNVFALLLASLFIFFTSATYFFDREHILLVFAFPYMLRFMPSLAQQALPLRTRIVIGLCAAFGFCIKPYTVIVFAGLQLLVCLRERRLAILWSVENGIIYLMGTVYLFCVWHFTPDYIRFIFPMALETYSAFSRRDIGIFYCILAFITAGLAFADFRPRHATPYRKDILYFIGVSLVFFVYALANNGWGYTYHPLLCMLLFLNTWVLWEHIWLKHTHAQRGLPVRQFVFGARACAINLLANAVYIVFCLGSFFMTPTCEWLSECRKNQPYVQYLAEHHIRSFGALTEDFHKWSSLARLSGASLDTRYNALWMVPGLVMKGKQFVADHHWIVEYAGLGLADDLNRRRPEIVFVDDSKRFFGSSLDVSLPGFFLQVPQFGEAWSHYRYTATIDRCVPATPKEQAVTVGCKYDIYSRVP